MRTKTWIFQLLLVFIFVGCRSTQPAQNIPDEEIIVYGFDGKIWQMNPDGTNNQVLVESASHFITPRLSPDKTQMLFFNRENQKSSLWISDVQGQNKRQINGNFDLMNAQWINPEIVLTSLITDVRMEVNPEHYFLLNVKDDSQRLYSDQAKNVFGQTIPFKDSWISWSDGRLTLHSVSAEPKLWLSNWLVPDSGGYAVSPSGQNVVFLGAPYSTKEYGIYKVVVEEANQPEKMIAMDCCISLYWSPDEQKIAVFSSQENWVKVLSSKTFGTLSEFDLDYSVEAKYGWSSNNTDFLVLADFDISEATKHNFELAKINMKTGRILRLTKNDKKESGAFWVTLER